MDPSSTEQTCLVAETRKLPPHGPSVTSLSKSFFAAIGMVMATVMLVVVTQLDPSSTSQYFQARHTQYFHACGRFQKAAFADMHDGDQKLVSIWHNKLMITPGNEKESWRVAAELDMRTCTAMVDFNVTGKPSPPPVPLLVTIWRMEQDHIIKAKHDTPVASKITMEWTDPSETIAPKNMPLNHWVELL
jgi:hypothetical protein